MGPVLFIIFINDLPDVIESICRLFADDAKVYRLINSKRDQEQLQKDLDSLFKWSEDWLLRFNVQKCKAMQVGKVHLECEYSMNNDKLKVENSEKDLGILFTSNLKFDKHISSIVNKANRVIGLIRRKFTFMDKNLFLTLYKALVRSTLDYGNIIFYPSSKKNKQMVENVQRRATRLIPELRELSYTERLTELKLSTLEYRRKRFDLIQVYKIVHGFDKVDMGHFFTFSADNGLRGHNLKLEKPKAKKGIRLHSFSHRVINEWNSLPSDLVNSKNVLTFKTALDNLWIEKRTDISEIY